MSPTIDVSDEIADRLDSHLEEGESREEMIEELLNIYEAEGTFMQEGYSE